VAIATQVTQHIKEMVKYLTRGLGHRSAVLPVYQKVTPYTAPPFSHKLLTKSQGTLCPAGSVSVVQPSWYFALVHPSSGFFFLVTRTMLTVQASMFRLRCIILSENLWQKLLRQQKIVTFFLLESVFQGSVKLAKIACALHQAIRNHG
jgi:hypothetical protein